MAVLVSKRAIALAPAEPAPRWPVARHSPRGLLAAQRRLHDARTMPELLCCASEAAADWCGFTRALVVSVEGQMLSAGGLRALADPSSDALRRKLLAAPVQLCARSAEAEAIRLAEIGRSDCGQSPSLLQAAFGLEQFAFGAVMPEDRVLALLVLDRSWPAVESSDRDLVQVFAHQLGCSVERLVLRQRMSEFALELRHLTASAGALIKEGLESPVTMPADYGSGPVFAPAYPEPRATVELQEPLTRRELSIVSEMVAGRSNREIAAQLQLSPETVKTYVARVMRKLGASNRADAAVKYLRLTSPATDG